MVLVGLLSRDGRQSRISIEAAAPATSTPCQWRLAKRMLAHGGPEQPAVWPTYLLEQEQAKDKVLEEPASHGEQVEWNEKKTAA